MKNTTSQNVEANKEKNNYKQTLQIVIRGKKIAVEYTKRFEGKEASINNDYQFYENLSINSIVELIKNKQVKKVMIDNNSKSPRFNGFFRDTVFKIGESTGLGWIQFGADSFELVEGKVNPRF